MSNSRVPVVEVVTEGRGFVLNVPIIDVGESKDEQNKRLTMPHLHLFKASLDSIKVVDVVVKRLILRVPRISILRAGIRKMFGKVVGSSVLWACFITLVCKAGNTGILISALVITISKDIGTDLRLLDGYSRFRYDYKSIKLNSIF